MKTKKSKYKKGDKVIFKLNGEIYLNNENKYGYFIIKRPDLQNKVWWYFLKGLENPSRQIELRPYNPKIHSWDK